VQGQASLILLNPTPISGAGLGNVNTVLTLQSPAASTTEAGCVLAGGTAGSAAQCTAAFGSGFTGGTVLTGAAQIGAPTIGTLGIVNATDLRIILNAAEPAGDAITVQQLALNLFNGTTLVGTTHTLAAPVTIPNTFTGVGQAGFAFGLNAAEAATVQAQLNALTPAQRAAVQVTLAAQLTGAGGAPESFSVARATGGVGGAEIPEPATMSLVGSALLGAAFLLRRKRR
jgi:hypothetical protein